MNFWKTAALALVTMVPGIVTAVGVGPALASDDYSQWSKIDTLFLNTTPDGANVTGMVTHFPLLVRLDGTHFNFTEAKGNGQDIRFSKRDGTHLHYQIDRWDSARGLAEVWVLMDTVYGNASDQILRMHWGNDAAADSSRGGAVFDTTNGFVAAWHMGGTGSAARPNSVTGGIDATPVYFDGGETTGGMIGLADSLDGDLSGDYLDVGVGYQNFTSGFTYSVWVYPTATSNFSRLLDLGNGPRDEIVVQRSGTSNDISFLNYNGATPSKTVTVTNAFPINQWQYFTFTVSGTTAKIYRNGALVGSDDLGNTITGALRPYNYLGHSDWSGNAYYRGMLDEPELAGVARSADWIKLSYANENKQQTLITYAPSVAPVLCVTKFAVPSDTTMPEGGIINLPGIADCADNYFWSTESGPAPRILDPENKVLQVFLPRVSRDTLIQYRFSANYGDSTLAKVVGIRIKETIPDPIFTLPSDLTWNGTDSLLIRPAITNLTAIQASAQPNLHFAWTLADMVPDTAWRDNGLLLKSSTDAGTMTVGLCLDNNGPLVCASMTVNVMITTSLLRKTKSPDPRFTAPAFDANGRRLIPTDRRARNPLPLLRKNKPTSG